MLRKELRRSSVANKQHDRMIFAHRASGTVCHVKTGTIHVSSSILETGDLFGTSFQDVI